AAIWANKKPVRTVGQRSADSLVRESRPAREQPADRLSALRENLRRTQRSREMALRSKMPNATNGRSIMKFFSLGQHRNDGFHAPLACFRFVRSLQPPRDRIQICLVERFKHGLRLFVLAKVIEKIIGDGGLARRVVSR